MRKIIVTMWVTLDGFIAGPNGELDWVRSEENLGNYEIDLVTNTGTLLLGGKTYGDFANYWPNVSQNPAADDFQKRYAQLINALDKIVISSSLQEASWEKTEIYRSLDRVKELKALSGGDILIYGSASVVRELANLGLVDEFHLLTHPVVLGSGKYLFEGVERRTELELVSSEVWPSGVVFSRYQVRK